MSLRDTWETRASDWVRWARSPELDNDFWDFHLPEFLRFIPDPGHRMVDGYAAERRYRYTVQNAGLQMTYEGAHRPLGAYFDALATAGFVVEALREPAALRDDGSPYVNFVHLRGRLLGGGPASS